MIERHVMALAAGMLAPVLAVGQKTPAPAPQASPTPAPAPTTAEPPIVPDDQFEKAMPPITGDINAPLQPIPTAPATSTAQTPPAVVGSPQATSDSAGLPAPTPPDPALAQPLQPLATFDTAPLDQTADVKDKSSVEIRYDTVAKGLDKVGLASRFKSLSALSGGHGKAANSAMISARAHEDEALAVRLMKSEGYYDGTAIATIEQQKDPKNPDAAGHVRVTLNAVPGKQYKIGSIAVQAQPTVPPDLVRQALTLKEGDPLQAARVEGAEANISLVLPQQGYPFVKVGQRDVLLDDQLFTAAYTLPVDTGPRSSFGDYSTDGKLAFSARHVGVLARFKRGQLYDNRKVDDLRQALVATGLFRAVAVEPKRTGEIAPDGTEIVNLDVHQTAGPSRTWAGSAGYSTGQGIRAEVSWTNRNLFPPEGALILDVIGGTQEQGASATFRRSNAGRRDKTFQVIASADHNRYDAYDAKTGTLAVRWSYDSTPLWQKRITYGYGAELTGTNESVYDYRVGDRVRGTYFIAALPGVVQFDTSDSLLNPTRGYRIKLTVSPETSVRGPLRPYVRGIIDASAYYPVTDSLVIAGRVRAGSIYGINRDDLAPSRRFYGGGGGSVRGYGYQELGPRDPQDNPVGGLSTNEAAIEARYRFGNFGIVPFFDAGQAYDSVLPKGSDLRYGAGIGARYYTNFGPLRVDVATPLNPRKGDSKIALYISIGQAF